MMRDADIDGKLAFILKMAGAIAAGLASRHNDEPDRIAEASIDLATRIWDRAQALETASIFVHDGRKPKPLTSHQPSHRVAKLTSAGVDLAIVKAQKLLDDPAAEFIEPDVIELARTVLALAFQRDDVIKELKRLDRAHVFRAAHGLGLDGLRNIIGDDGL